MAPLGKSKPYPGENALLPYVKKVGTGVKGSRPLTREEARTAMERILEGAFHPATLGAFTIALRFRGERAEELAGFLEALRARMELPELPPLPEPFLDTAGAYDGKRRTYHLALAANLIVACAGVKVLMHGSRGIPTKFGMTPWHVLSALGIPIPQTPQEAHAQLLTLGISYLHEPVFHPQLYALRELRIALGKRGFLNTLEPLLNPFSAPYHLSGFFHEPYGPLCGETLRLADPELMRVILVAGVEGSEELRPTRSYFLEVTPQGSERVEVDLKGFGFKATMQDLEPEEKEESFGEGEASLGEGALEDPWVLHLARRSAERIERFLAGEPGGYGEVVLLNAGLRLYTAGITPGLPEGVELARSLWHSSQPLLLLRRWQGYASEGQLASPPLLAQAASPSRALPTP